jgi:hypothetical protein
LYPRQQALPAETIKPDRLAARSSVRRRGTPQACSQSASAPAAADVVLLVGASPVYLGAHWLTDVLAGYALGATWLALLVALHQRHRSRPAGQLRARPTGTLRQMPLPDHRPRWAVPGRVQRRHPRHG